MKGSDRRTTRARPADGSRRGVKLALVLSLAAHAALVLGLLELEAQRSPVVPQTIEIAIDTSTLPVPGSTPEVGSAAPATADAHGPSRAGPAKTAASGERDRARSASAPAITATTPSSDGDAPTPSPSPERNGWGSTFLPAHPDLSVGGKLALPAEPRRDPLAPPTARVPLPTEELPKTLRGGAGVTADVSEDGTLRFRDARNLGYDVPHGTGRFDLTDAIMRMGGQDPYAPIKRKLADETREQRVCMAKRAQDKRQREALLGLASDIKQIARRVDLSPLDRRRLVFEIWDECAEERGDASHDWGAMARDIIAATIRQVFPAGTELAYSAGELASLNQRRGSRDRFSPYDLKRDAGAPRASEPAQDCP